MVLLGRKESWGGDSLMFSQSHLGAGGIDGENDMWDDGAILKRVMVRSFRELETTDPGNKRMTSKMARLTHGDLARCFEHTQAFDDALSTHTRKFVSGEEGRKYSKDPSQRSPTHNSSRGHGRQEPQGGPLQSPAGGRSSLPGRTTDQASLGMGGTGDHTVYSPSSAKGQGDRAGEDGQGYQQGDNRYDNFRVKGGIEHSPAARRGAGIPGPWEPVVPPREVERETSHAHDQVGDSQHRGILPQDAGQRPDYPRPPGGPYDPMRPEDYGVYHQHYGAPRPSPSGAIPHMEEAFDRYAMPPPPPPPVPHPGAGPHAAAFQSLEGIHDDDLADLLLAWYYSGYYTGRYRAMQEARTARYRRSFPPAPTVPPPPAPPSTTQEPWDRHPWTNYYPPQPGHIQSPAHHERAVPRGTVPSDGRSGLGRRVGP